MLSLSCASSRELEVLIVLGIRFFAEISMREVLIASTFYYVIFLYASELVSSDSVA